MSREPVEVQVLLRPRGARDFVATFRYDPADPCAVTILIPPANAAGHEESEWVVARDLLVDGLKRPVGVGDFRVRPARIPGRVRLEFVDVTDRTVYPVTASRDRLQYLLRRTYGLVPPGQEITELDIDAFIAGCRDGAL